MLSKATAHCFLLFVCFALAADLVASTVVNHTYFKASNTEAEDNFGHSIALDANTLVIGANRESSSASGANGDQSNNDLERSGAVYVFALDDEGGWVQQAYLKASNTGSFDNFGNSVAIFGDTLVVGAPFENGASSGVNGEQNNDGIGNGAAYVFARDESGVWTQQAYLKASNSHEYAWFGWSVAISGNTVVVGARGERSSATGVNGNQSNDNWAESGAAYVFVRDDEGIWSQQAYLKASNTDLFDEFGRVLAIDGDTLVVGAAREASSAVGINGDQSRNDAFFSGAAYIFSREGTNWTQDAYLKASNTGSGDSFGRSVAVSGDSVIVGAPGEGSNAVNINGDQANNDAPGSGAAYVFIRTDQGWIQQAYLKASNAEPLSGFGASVGISEETVVVGAPYQDRSGAGINSFESNGDLAESGAFYVFSRNGDQWSQQAYVKAPNADAHDAFGTMIAIDESKVLVATREESSNAKGVDGDQLNNGAPGAGAAYLYDFGMFVNPPVIPALNFIGLVVLMSLLTLFGWKSLRRLSFT